MFSHKYFLKKKIDIDEENKKNQKLQLESQQELLTKKIGKQSVKLNRDKLSTQNMKQVQEINKFDTEPDQQGKQLEKWQPKKTIDDLYKYVRPEQAESTDKFFLDKLTNKLEHRLPVKGFQTKLQSKLDGDSVQKITYQSTLNKNEQRQFPQFTSAAIGNLENFKHIKRVNNERNEYLYTPEKAIAETRSLFKTQGSPFYESQRDQSKTLKMRSLSKSKSTADFSNEDTFSRKFSQKKLKISKWMVNKDNNLDNLFSNEIKKTMGQSHNMPKKQIQSDSDLYYNHQLSGTTLFSQSKTDYDRTFARTDSIRNEEFKREYNEE